MSQFDFEALARKALRTGHVDQPLADDHEDTRQHNMSELLRVIDDLCAFANEHGKLDSESIFEALAVYLGAQIVRLTRDTFGTAELYQQVIKVLTTSIVTTLMEKDLNQ